MGPTLKHRHLAIRTMTLVPGKKRGRSADAGIEHGDIKRVRSLIYSSSSFACKLQSTPKAILKEEQQRISTNIKEKPYTSTKGYTKFSVKKSSSNSSSLPDYKSSAGLLEGRHDLPGWASGLPNVVPETVEENAGRFAFPAATRAQRPFLSPVTTSAESSPLWRLERFEAWLKSAIPAKPSNSSGPSSADDPAARLKEPDNAITRSRQKPPSSPESELDFFNYHDEGNNDEESVNANESDDADEDEDADEGEDADDGEDAGDEDDSDGDDSSSSTSSSSDSGESPDPPFLYVPVCAERIPGPTALRCRNLGTLRCVHAGCQRGRHYRFCQRCRALQVDLSRQEDRTVLRNWENVCRVCRPRLKHQHLEGITTCRCAIEIANKMYCRDCRTREGQMLHATGFQSQQLLDSCKVNPRTKIPSWGHPPRPDGRFICRYCLSGRLAKEGKSKGVKICAACAGIVVVEMKAKEAKRRRRQAAGLVPRQMPPRAAKDTARTAMQGMR